MPQHVHAVDQGVRLGKRCQDISISNLPIRSLVSFAQFKVSELQAEGKTYTEALGQTSLEMGHSRVGITLHYLSD